MSLKSIFKEGTSFIKKNSTKIGGALLTAGGATLVATGIGAPVGTAMAGAGLKMALTKTSGKTALTEAALGAASGSLAGSKSNVLRTVGTALNSSKPASSAVSAKSTGGKTLANIKTAIITGVKNPVSGIKASLGTGKKVNTSSSVLPSVSLSNSKSAGSVLSNIIDIGNRTVNGLNEASKDPNQVEKEKQQNATDKTSLNTILFSIVGVVVLVFGFLFLKRK